MPSHPVIGDDKTKAKPRLSARSRVKKANSIKNFATTLPASCQTFPPFSLECYRFRDLPKSIETWALNLYEFNMKQLMTSSSFGWHPKHKLLELKHWSAWCLLVKDAENKPTAFVNFRFDLDYGKAVLYCYEIHVDPSFRRHGLGGYLIKCLEIITKTTGMDKVVVTVLKTNDVSLAFFNRMRFVEDDTNPTDEDEADYVILSKTVDD